MTVVRDRVFALQKEILELQAAFGEAAIPHGDFEQAAIPLGIPARFVIQNQLSDSLRKMIVTSVPTFFGVEERLPEEADVLQAEERVRTYTTMLAELRPMLPSAVRSASVSEELSMEETLDKFETPPDPAKVAVDTFKEEVAGKLKSVRNWTIFGGSGLVVLAVGTAAAFAIAYAFFQGFLIRAKNAGKG